MVAVVQRSALNGLIHAKTQVWPLKAELSGEMMFSIHSSNEQGHTAHIF